MEYPEKFFNENFLRCTFLISLDKEDVRFVTGVQPLFMEAVTGVVEKRRAGVLMSMKEKSGGKILKQGV